MLENEEILRGFWNGQIAVHLTLSQEDEETIPNPLLRQLFVLFRRVSYLPLAQSRILEYWKPEHPENVWFSTPAGEVLQWHYPIGLLYDLHGNGQVPWQLTVHLQHFPLDKLLRLDTGSTPVEPCLDAFMSTIKESDYLRHGSVKRVFGLPKQDQLDLWDGLVQGVICDDSITLADDFDKFWKVNSTLIHDPESIPKSIPLRIYDSSDHTSVFQRKISVFTESLGNFNKIKKRLEQTLGQLLNTYALHHKRAFLHGIEIPLDTSILFLGKYCVYPDNFCHLVLQ